MISKLKKMVGRAGLGIDRDSQMETLIVANKRQHKHHQTTSRLLFRNHHSWAPVGLFTTDVLPPDFSRIAMAFFHWQRGVTE